MGNCHAAPEVIGILVEHPEGKVERLYWSLTARQLMLQYPGNYVALVPAPRSPDLKTPLRVAGNKLKLLPPDAALQVGEHYRLVSFEALKEFGVSSARDYVVDINAPAGKHMHFAVQLADVLLEISEQNFMGRSSSMGPKSKRVYSAGDFPAQEDDDLSSEMEDRPTKFTEGTGGFGSFATMRSMSFSKSGQWRPVLQSISELGR